MRQRISTAAYWGRGSLTLVKATGAIVWAGTPLPKFEVASIKPVAVQDPRRAEAMDRLRGMLPPGELTIKGRR